MITSRIAGYTGSPVLGAREIELQAFTDEDTKRFIAAWPLPPAAASLLLDRARDPAVAAMGRIPLLLALLCWLAAQLAAGEVMPRTPGQLFDRVLRWFLSQPHRSPAAAPLTDTAIDALMETLTPLAFTFATQPAGWVDLMPGDRLLDAIRTTGPAFTERRQTAAEVLRELAVDADVLVPAGDPSAGRSPGYLFFHRAAAEYLVARHLATLPWPDWLAIVEQHRWFDPDWAEVILMLGERLNQAAARNLIGHLLGDDIDPFHHSLFIAIRVWGARPDSDQLLPASKAADLTEQLTELFIHHGTRNEAVSCLKAMAYLPQPQIPAGPDRRRLGRHPMAGQLGPETRVGEEPAERHRDEPVLAG